MCVRPAPDRALPIVRCHCSPRSPFVHRHYHHPAPAARHHGAAGKCRRLAATRRSQTACRAAPSGAIWRRRPPPRLHHHAHRLLAPLPGSPLPTGPKRDTVRTTTLRQRAPPAAALSTLTSLQKKKQSEEIAPAIDSLSRERSKRGDDRSPIPMTSGCEFSLTPYSTRQRVIKIT